MQEGQYGSHSSFRNDEHDDRFPQFSVSPFSQAPSSKDSELTDFEERFKLSQREIDLYYFYFSSRL